MGRDKKAPNPPSRASLLKLARSVVAEVSDTKETKPQQHYTKELKLLRKRLKGLGFQTAIPLTLSLLKQIPSSATRKEYGDLNLSEKELMEKNPNRYRNYRANGS